MTGSRSAVIAALGLGAALAGCGGTASHIDAGTFYSAKGYTVRLPDRGWRVQAQGAADLELTRDTPPGGMLADATCVGPEPTRPLPILARHATIGLGRRQTLESATETLDGRPAERTVVRGVLDGAPVIVESIVVKGERCVHDFLYVAPPDAFESGRPDFRAFVQSFARREASR